MRRKRATSADIEAVYRDRFRGFVLSMTAFLRDGDAALDVVQEGFALALRRRRSFRRDGPLEGWIWRIVLNVARDRQRVQRRQARVLAREVVAENETLPEADLRAAVLALPERQRLATFLRYYADLSYPQIADALGVRPGTVAAALHAAHAALRTDLEEVSQ